MALCYSVAEYCAPVWTRSAHTQLVDVQLNSTMRLISGTLQQTPLAWLPVLSNIAPPALRRKAATERLVQQVSQHPDWGLNKDLSNHPWYRLPSRHPLWKDAQSTDIATQWREDWKSAKVVNCDLVADPAIRQPGFDLPRMQWSLLNRFRTAQGPCRVNLKKWGLASSELCDCGVPQSMSHIVEQCPITKLDGGLKALHKADNTACIWLTHKARNAFAK